MPIYTYQCPRGHHFDKRVAMSKMDELQPCEGSMVDPGRPVGGEGPKVVPCKTPAKRLEVPSSPATFIMR